MSREEIIALARAAGFQPVRRTTTYQVLEEY
jgi:2-iminoacetate synthase ThiH